MTRFFSTTLIAFCVTFATGAYSEIYQWRDENGKLHFGDTPPEKSDAESVDIGPINQADEVKVDDASLRRNAAKKRLDEKRRREEKQRQAQHKRKLAKACKKAAKEYVDLKGGEHRHSKHTVLIEDGKPISRREQNEVAERYRKKMNAQGCNIPFKEW